MYLKCKSGILVVNLKCPGIPTHLILIKLTWSACVLIYVNEDKLLFFISLQNNWNYIIIHKSFTLLICIMRLSQEITEIYHNETIEMFVFLVVRSYINLFINNDKCVFNIIFRCYSKCTNRGILTHNINTQHKYPT